MARAPASVIIRRAGQAPSRRQPLSSNVRQQLAAPWCSPALLGAAVAAEHQMPSLLGALAVRVNDGAASFWPCRPGAHRAVSGRFAGNVCLHSESGETQGRRLRVQRVVAPWRGRLQQVHAKVRLPATLAHRRALASMVLSGGQLALQRFSRRCSSHRLSGNRTGLHQTLLPNPSLVGTATGKALGPRGRRSYHRPRGPSAFPASAPQLKR